MNKRLFYLHIPKNAGMTVRTVLGQLYRRSSLCGYFTTQPKKSMERIKGLNQSQLNNIKLVYGHFSYGFHNYFKDTDYRYFTFLRDPVARVVSHYYFAKNRKNHYLYNIINSKNISLIEYVSQGICPEVNNGMTKQIAGAYVAENFGYYSSKLDNNLDESKLLDRAYSVINRDFILVGLTEYFDESLLLLENFLPGSHINFKYLKVNQNIEKTYSKKHQITKEEREIIEKYNQCDIRLYKECKARFEDKIEKLEIEDFNDYYTPNLFEKYYLKARRRINRYL